MGAVSIIAVGFHLRKKLILRVTILDKLILETEELKRGILIYKKPIDIILSKLTLPPFKRNFNPKDDNEEFLLVYEMVNKIKNSLEKGSESLLEDRIEKLKTIRKEAENELKTKGIMFVKASILLALLFVVIII